jgi:hypothetical protein
MKIPAIVNGIIVTLAARQSDESHALRHVYNMFTEDQDEIDAGIAWLCKEEFTEIVKVNNSWDEEDLIILKVLGKEHVTRLCNDIEDARW